MRPITSLLALVALGAVTGAAQEPAAPAAAAGSALSVEAVLARNVVDRLPQDSGTSFPADVGQLVLWTRVTGAEGETAIHHVWFRGDQEVGNLELRVGGSPWRTWSRKSIPADWTGPWRVEVRDASGAVLTSVNFTIGQ